MRKEEREKTEERNLDYRSTVRIHCWNEMIDGEHRTAGAGSSLVVVVN